MNSFEFPKAYDFPPFFTRQPAEKTWQDQLGIWIQLILDYFKFHNKYVLNISECQEMDIFNNTKINRSAKLELVVEIIDNMCKKGKAEWNPNFSSKSQCYIYWRTPEEWSRVIIEWVDEKGLGDSIVTMYELTRGEDFVGSSFENLDPYILKKALNVLKAKGKIKLFTGSDPDELGIKFCL